MGDMAEDFKELSEIRQEQREKRAEKWLPILHEKGAKELTCGVYRLGDWDFYPYKGGARNFKTGQRAPIGRILETEVQDE